MESLEAHLTMLVRLKARSSEWLGMDLTPICCEIERRVEAAYPDEEDTQISARCHRRIRKLGKALRLGWELELLGLGDAPGAAGGEDVDAGRILDRLDTLGPKKQAGYRHIKVGDRRGSAAFARSADGEDDDGAGQGLNTTANTYSDSVAAVALSMWHRNATRMCAGALRELGAEEVLDIGSSFNPLREDFLRVTALDAVPACPGVLAADFLGVELEEGLTAPRLDPDSPGVCLAVPAGFYDAVVLSLVLRSVPGVPQRHEMVRRAAKAVRVGGHLAIVERGALGAILKYNGSRQGRRRAPWQAAGLRRHATLRGLRGTFVNIFERVA